MLILQICSLQHPQVQSLPHGGSSSALELACKAVHGCAPAYLQELVRRHTPARALHSTTSAGRLAPPSLRGTTKVAQQSHNSSPFWHRNGARSSLPISGLQSREAASARDSGLTCSEFTWTLHSLLTPHLHSFLSLLKTPLLRTFYMFVCPGT